MLFSSLIPLLLLIVFLIGWRKLNTIIAQSQIDDLLLLLDSRCLTIEDKEKIREEIKALQGSKKKKTTN